MAKTGQFASFLATTMLFLLLASANAFLLQKTPVARSSLWGRLAMASGAAEPFEIEVKIPPSNSELMAQMKFNPVLSVPSEIVEVRYKLPFGLDVAPKDNLAICTKDGAGGEKVGDVLRFTSQWTMGLPRGNGLVTTAASFAGGLSWQCSMFDVMKASQWEAVVEALVSNVESRTDEVVLLFERPLEREA